MEKILEICVDSVESGVAAAKGGADRLEVNYALALGGLTPSNGLMKQLKGEVDIPLVAMVRPRMGYFCYTEPEFVQMQREAEEMLSCGAEGLAFGFIGSDGEIDVGRVKEFVKLAGGCETVFHRAFDLLDAPLEAVHILADLGVSRILTSGGKSSAYEGRETIKNLIAAAGDRIEILPGGGINPENAAEFLQYSGAVMLHSSCSQKIYNSQQEVAGISFIDPEISDNLKISLDSEKVGKLLSILKPVV